MTPRVFGVDYAFLSCGSVFTEGLAHAAAALGVPYAHGVWNAPDLIAELHAFRPDVVFVVHGRHFAATYPKLPHYRSAVWLLDEPYEVDDTARWSPLFDHVFVNDRATVDRHAGASYLPVCYDPVIYREAGADRAHAVGFIGGGNDTRDRYLGALARAGLLTYAIGGPWRDPSVADRCLARTISARETARWYQTTRIVVNIFRDRHHFNGRGIAATALNPRVYEALACGALVVSEWRPEVDALVPELPTFRTEAECVALVAELLAAPVHAAAIQAHCAAQLADDTYAQRLTTVLAAVGTEVLA